MQRVPLNQVIVDWEDNTRGPVIDVASLMESIRTQGLLQPVIVAREGEKYRLIAGYRRYTAFTLLAATDPRYEEIPVYIVAATTLADRYAINIIENLHRKNIGIIAEAKALARANMDINELARQIGVSESWVLNRLRLLKLPDYIQVLIERGVIPEANIRKLSKVKDAKLMTEIARRYTEAADDNSKPTPRLVSSKVTRRTKDEIADMRRKTIHPMARLTLDWAVGMLSTEEFLKHVHS